MKIWDISPGYLNRQSLLTEHRELHDLVSIIRDNKKAYAKHPEVVRWLDHGWALRQRHQLLVAEMLLRGCDDSSLVSLGSNEKRWPTTFIDSPASQLAILARQSRQLGPGRIPLPRNVQQLWAQHKYSVMARDIAAYKSIGRRVASLQDIKFIDDLLLELVKLLQTPPNPKLVNNALLHMWGYVSKYSTTENRAMDAIPTKPLLNKIQQLALSYDVCYLIHSTALSELNAWNL